MSIKDDFLNCGIIGGLMGSKFMSLKVHKNSKMLLICQTNNLVNN